MSLLVYLAQTLSLKFLSVNLEQIPSYLSAIILRVLISLWSKYEGGCFCINVEHDRQFFVGRTLTLGHLTSMRHLHS
ncbi:MAG: hypothetical protein ACI9JR_002172 [Gammaproteobacteria bacterium]|jgi:hypothetical protein